MVNKAKRSPKAKSITGESRRHIVAAAMTCFTKYGVVKTTFKEIAKEAKVHQPLIGYYFPDFDSLFVAVVEVLLADLKDASIAAIKQNMDDPRKALEAYILAPIEWTAKDNGNSALWTFFYYLASYQPMFKAMNNSIREVGRERISLLLYKYQEAYHLKLKEGWTMERLANAVQADITGAVTMAATETCDPIAAAKLSQQTIATLLDSVFVKTS